MIDLSICLVKFGEVVTNGYLFQVFMEMNSYSDWLFVLMSTDVVWHSFENCAPPLRSTKVGQLFDHGKHGRYPFYLPINSGLTYSNYLWDLSMSLAAGVSCTPHPDSLNFPLFHIFIYYCYHLINLLVQSRVRWSLSYLLCYLIFNRYDMNWFLKNILEGYGNAQKSQVQKATESSCCICFSWPQRSSGNNAKKMPSQNAKMNTSSIKLHNENGGGFTIVWTDLTDNRKLVWAVGCIWKTTSIFSKNIELMNLKWILMKTKDDLMRGWSCYFECKFCNYWLSWPLHLTSIETSFEPRYAWCKCNRVGRDLPNFLACVSKCQSTLVWFFEPGYTRCSCKSFGLFCCVISRWTGYQSVSWKAKEGKAGLKGKRLDFGRISLENGIVGPLWKQQKVKRKRNQAFTRLDSQFETATKEDRAYCPKDTNNDRKTPWSQKLKWKAPCIFRTSVQGKSFTIKVLLPAVEYQRWRARRPMAKKNINVQVKGNMSRPHQRRWNYRDPQRPSPEPVPFSKAFTDPSPTEEERNPEKGEICTTTFCICGAQFDSVGVG